MKRAHRSRCALFICSINTHLAVSRLNILFGSSCEPNSSVNRRTRASEPVQDISNTWRGSRRWYQVAISTSTSSTPPSTADEPIVPKSRPPFS